MSTVATSPPPSTSLQLDHLRALEAESIQIMREVVAETVLLDWEGFTAGGKPYPYSVENAKHLFAQPHLHDFYDMVRGLSEDLELFKQSQDADAKNASPPA